MANNEKISQKKVKGSCFTDRNAREMKQKNKKIETDFFLVF